LAAIGVLAAAETVISDTTNLLHMTTVPGIGAGRVYRRW